MSHKEGRVKAEPLPWWPKCCRGRWMEAQWSPQWSLNGRHWSAKGGTMVVQGRQTCRSNWYTMFAFFTGRPMADHCASILRPRRWVCLHPASFERPVSDRPPRRPLCDCFEHAQNITTTMASMAMSERPLCHPWTTKATVLPPLCLQRRPDQFCGRTREAQWSQPLCKGGIIPPLVEWGFKDQIHFHCAYSMGEITCHRKLVDVIINSSWNLDTNYVRKRDPWLCFNASLSKGTSCL